MTSTKLTLALTAYAGAVFGQNAQLSGLIQDPSALKVSGAEISVRNEQTGGRRSTNSNDDGFYSVFSLSPGVYRIARSALPTDILDSNAVPVSFGFRNSGGRPNLVPGQPLYLYGSGYPGGKSYNAAAFSNPPPGTQGNLGRNVLRGFGAWQIDFALHRNFRLSERTGLQFRAEVFNILAGRALCSSRSASAFSRNASQKF